MKVKSLSRVRSFATPWTVAHPGSSIHRILQARVLEWVAISFSRGTSRPKGRTQVSRIVVRRFTVWATRKKLYSNLKTNKQTNYLKLLSCWKEPNWRIVSHKSIMEQRIQRDLADDTTLMAEIKEELKSLLMKVKEEWKSWLKTQHS